MPEQPEQIDDIKHLIERFFSDTSRSKEETLEGLESLRDDLDQRIDMLLEDLESGSD
jgi:hypothetical protein